ncbi:ABC transporter substrate-binding protein [Chelatococcus composti]|jgi:ABC-type branched-chain amino acid transport systems, periplasmic component|uniref:Branched-chain amino acid transport system substrate-binding protein n=1 Tax=Chelatococcus composti TaxID=1743235 RepID=A0A841KEX4_9HYPH|nr:ABC transporter substrate-binding protein [Chelatococcus composti]MBB6167973.1 branched-chain amino acid transport system substrate-binding protein [Chelatococcus composti]MBS7734833.1 ABC transporter substrate-binding protein [Chelatococcus composti]PZN41887.1 MAG: branched chain amino acid ABC transporter substrate-binding protein [Pseudomonadota bacterium]GGG34471.1 branched chain amino acid ABC transporter substrate-binding protein [Chelatococcus composti]
MNAMTKLMLSACAAALLAASPARADVTFALGIPATGGQIAAIGAQARLGAEAAVKAINDKGGIKGEKLVLEIADDQCDPKSAVSAANQVVSKGIRFVVGHLCSGASIAASGVYDEEGILMMTASATAPELTDRGMKLVFRACGRDDQQGVVAAKFIADKFKGKKVAIVHDKQVYGQGLAEAAKKTLAEAGVTPAYEGSVNAGERDFSALVARLKQEGIDIVYYGGYHTELGLIVRQARQAGLETRFVGADGLATNEFWSIAGEGGAGTLFTFSADVKAKPSAKDVYEELKKSGEPDNFAFYYYAAVQALADAVARAGKEPEAVAEDLRKNSFETVVGSFRFDAKGDLIDPEYVIFEWRDGAYAPTKL